MNLEKILSEIYEIDEGLREHDAKLRKAVEMMLASKPQINSDKNFEKKLRDDLLQYARNLKQKPKFNFNFNPMKKFAYAFGGVALAALIIVPFVYQPDSQSDVPSGASFEMNDAVDDFDLNLDENFNADVIVNESGTRALGGEEAVADMAYSKEMSIMPYPGRSQNYVYKYVGDELEMSEEKMPVLKKKEVDMKSSLENILSGFSLDGLDLSKFTDLNVRNITVYEDRENGYEININLEEGSVSIYRNWDSWEDDSDEYAIDPDSVKEFQIIKIADDFMRKYGVDLTNYGKPELEEDFAVIMARDYRPESYSVIYPFLVDGKKIVSSWGNVEGINVTVDLKSGAVTGLYGLSFREYEGKNYDTVQDFSAVKKYVESLGYEKLSFEDEADVQTAEVQSPEMVWLPYSSYNGKKTSNYLIPALRFEIKYPEKDYWGNKNIIVPLIEDMFERLEK